MCIYKRVGRLKEIVEMFKRQTRQDFNLNIWNNSGQKLSIDFPKERLMIVDSPKNIGAIGRFNLVKLVKGNVIVFIDDDELIDDDFIDYNYNKYCEFGDDCVLGWYNKIFKSNDYRDEEIFLPEGTLVDYIGTGGMILNRKLFDDNCSLYDIKCKCELAEDLYLCFIAKSNGYKLIAIDKKCEQINDGQNFTSKLPHNYKTDALNELISKGFKIGG